MSPVSRGRKGKKQQRGPATGRSRGDRSNAGLDGFEGLYAEMLRAFRPLVKVIDPLEVEVFASDLVGAWWRQLPPGRRWLPAAGLSRRGRVRSAECAWASAGAWRMCTATRRACW